MYTLPHTQLEMGAGLRQQRGLDQHEKQGAIERVFSVELGQSAIRSIITRYAITGKSLRASWDARDHGLRALLTLRCATIENF